jgi:GAF domain
LPFLYLWQDERFNREIDVQTGYRTKALLCMPIKDASGDVVGVAQVINKQGDACFTANDEKVRGPFAWLNACKRSKGMIINTC